MYMPAGSQQFGGDGGNTGSGLGDAKYSGRNPGWLDLETLLHCIRELI